MNLRGKSISVVTRPSFFSVAGAITFMLMALGVQAQNLFVSDIGDGAPGKGKIYEYTPGGARSTFATGLSIPLGLTFDSAGNLFEADQTSGSIYEFTPGGVKSTFASGLYEPQALAFDSTGDLYVADFGSHFANTGYLRRFTPDGTGTVIATGLNPTAMAINAAGNIFVTDSETSGIDEITPEGVTTVFDTGGMYHPFGLAFDRAGDLFESVAGYNGGPTAIYEFTPDGSKSTFATGLDFPMGLAFDGAGNLFVTEYEAGAIYEYTPDGVRSTFATGLGQAGPTQIAFQPVPEPPVSACLAIAVVALLLCRSRNLPIRTRGSSAPRFSAARRI